MRETGDEATFKLSICRAGKKVNTSSQAWGIFLVHSFAAIGCILIKKANKSLLQHFFPPKATSEVHFHRPLSFTELQSPGWVSGAPIVAGGQAISRHSVPSGKGWLFPRCKPTVKVVDWHLHDTTNSPAADHSLTEANHSRFGVFPQEWRLQWLAN